ncbi:MAG TPA: ribosome-associated translation inhibitor RaiA [Clostridia bacterium]|nr:ribosome-associated translation inhibitor RaiA [Clostridia bacterium]
MNIELRVHNSDVVQMLRQYVERRLRFSLSKFGDRLSHVAVHISEDGTEVKSCRVNVEAVPFGAVSAEASDSDVFAAIDRASGRVARQIGHKFQRARALQNEAPRSQHGIKGADNRAVARRLKSA